MPKPVEAYREGYEKGRKDGPGGGLAEVTMGMLRDDPGGYFAAGYRDGAAGQKFNPPSPEARKTPPRKSAGSSATPLEKDWYGLCHSSSFIPTHVVDYYVAALKAEGSHVAIVIGLSDFTFHTCPKCGVEGQFKIRFLGRLEHLEHWTGYMGTGSYIGFQISRIVHSGIRAGGSVKEDSDKKGERASGWIGGILAFVFVAVFRAALAVVLIPLHTIIAICQTGQGRADVVTRVVTLCLIVAGIGLGVYEIQKASRPQFQQVQLSQPAALILGKWYPQVSFIPRAGVSVWEFLSNGQAIEYGYSDQNIDHPAFGVRPQRETGSSTNYSIGPDVLSLGTGVWARRFKIVRLDSNQLVVVQLPDLSKQPFEQRFAHSWQWPMN